MPSGKVHDKITLITAAAAVPIWWFFAPVKNVAEIAMVVGSYIFSGLWLSDDLDTNSISYQRWGALRWLWYPYQKLVPHRSWISHGIGVGPLLRVAYFIAMVWIVVRCVTWLLNQWGVPINREVLLGNVWHQTLSWTMAHPSYALLGLVGLILGGVAHSVADTVVSYAKKVW